MIRGEKVILRAIELEDLERCHRWMNDPDVTQFLSTRFPLSLQQERKWIEQERDPMRDLALAIETLEGVHIGNCGLHGIHAVDRSAGLGISIGEKSHWSQGYGTDAMLTLCGFGFGQMNLHRIWLYVFDFNARGIRCYEKCGFQHEGRLREAIFRHGKYRDVLVMGILAEEFQQKWPGRLTAGGDEG